MFRFVFFNPHHKMQSLSLTISAVSLTYVIRRKLDKILHRPSSTSAQVCIDRSDVIRKFTWEFYLKRSLPKRGSVTRMLKAQKSVPVADGFKSCLRRISSLIHSWNSIFISRKSWNQRTNCCFPWLESLGCLFLNLEEWWNHSWLVRFDQKTSM